MNILFVVTNEIGNYGGSERYVSVLSNALVEKGHKVAVICSGGPLVQYLDKKVIVKSVGPVIGASVRERNNLAVVIERIVNKHKIELIHSNSMMDIKAAIGIHQLPRVNKYWKRREEIVKRYNEAFKDLPLFTPAQIELNTRHAYHLYILLLDIDRLKITRDQFIDKMTKRNIGVGVHYIALHLHPYYQKTFGYKRGDFPNAEWISDRTVSIPLSAKLKDEDVGDVIDAVGDIKDNR